MVEYWSMKNVDMVLPFRSFSLRSEAFCQNVIFSKGDKMKPLKGNTMSTRRHYDKNSNDS